MPVFSLPFDQVSALNKRDIHYQMSPQDFKSFISYQPDIEGLTQAISDRSTFSVDRDLIQEVLRSQYEGVALSEKQAFNLDQLAQDTTFTVITAHQPSLLFGPMYYITKMLSAIRLAEELKANNPNIHIVPLFINGSEDHDFEEVNHVQLFGKSLTWESGQSGPVGRMSIAGLESVIAEFVEILGKSDKALRLSTILQENLLNSPNYNSYVFKVVNALMRDFGILVVNMDDVRFKRAFLPILEQEIFGNKSAALVRQSQKALAAMGYPEQAFVRDINVFYMSDGRRDRLEYVDGLYTTVDSDLKWTEEELRSELNQHPDAFSPNVVMRPLYQEIIWPNIAYIGGGGELAYWMERKTQFEAFGVFFPVLLRRNSILIVPKNISSQWEKLGFSWQDFFQPEHTLIQQYLNAQTSFDISLHDEIATIEQTLKIVANKAQQAEQTLGPWAQAEGLRIIKQIEQIESRIKRALKKQEETSLNQITKIKDKLFPNNGLQERKDSLLQFLVTENEGFIEELCSHCNPLNKDFLVII